MPVSLMSHTDYSVLDTLKNVLRAERRNLQLLLAALVLLEIVGLTGLCPPPHAAIPRIFSVAFMGLLQGTGRIGMLSLLYCCAGASVREVISLLTIGGVTALLVSLGVMQPWMDPVGFLDYGMQTMGVATAARMAFQMWRGTAQQRAWVARITAAFFIIWLMSLNGPSILVLSSTLHPATHDLEIYKLDAAFGLVPSVYVGQWLNTVPDIFFSLCNLAYSGLPIALVALCGLQLNGRHPASIRMMDVMLIGGFSAAIAYHLYPIAGPAFVFGDQFPMHMPAPDAVPVSKVVIDPAPRNGMPSMHFGWALAAAYLASAHSLFVRVVYALIGMLVAIATLGLGQHYLVDLLVALPFLLMVMSLCDTQLPRPDVRLKLILIGAILYLSWLILFRTAIPLILSRPIILWAWAALSSGLSVAGFVMLHRHQSRRWLVN